jgi:hypothetical protein
LHYYKIDYVKSTIWVHDHDGPPFFREENLSLIIFTENICFVRHVFVESEVKHHNRNPSTSVIQDEVIKVERCNLVVVFQTENYYFYNNIPFPKYTKNIRDVNCWRN